MVVILVCGFGRCGSSMVMQMLAAGGMPVVGEHPAYEDLDCNPITLPMIPRLDGKAVKLLNPHLDPIPVGPKYRAVWLDRNLMQQARSTVKFLRGVAGITVKPRDAKRIARAGEKDRPRALAALRQALHGEPLVLRFEDILADPLEAAQQLAMICRREMDVQAMARRVLPRSPQCRPDMLIESMLMEARP